MIYLKSFDVMWETLYKIEGQKFSSFTGLSGATIVIKGTFVYRSLKGEHQYVY